MRKRDIERIDLSSTFSENALFLEEIFRLLQNSKLDSYSITIFHVSLLDLQLINFIRSVYSLHVIYRKTPNTLSLLRAFFQQELIPTHTSTNIPTLPLTTCNSMDLAV